MVSTTVDAGRTGIDRSHRRVIFASSLGTVFEWYDFYLYGSLSAIISKQFFSGVNETTGFIFALLAFAAGFFVRPFGALLFGRFGDTIGRKHTFLITIVLMGASTALVGLLPSYEAIGVAAPRNMLRTASAACIRAGSRPPRRSACSCRCSSSSGADWRSAMSSRCGAGAFPF